MTMQTNTARFPLPAVEFTFAGFNWPRYVADMPRGGSRLVDRLAVRLNSCCGPYYHAPRPIAGRDHGKGFYLESDGAPGLRWQWCDDVCRNIGHTGWFTDDHGDGDKIRGVVFRLPRSRGFLAGWSMGEGIASTIECTIYADEVEAAYAADAKADIVAEYERDQARIESEEQQQDVA